MLHYVIRRLALLPITLFCIILINFIIINLAPGDPVTITEISQEGNASRSADRAMAFGSDERYLQFRERYGLTLPILFNNWPWLSQDYVNKTLNRLVSRKAHPYDSVEVAVKEDDVLRVLFGDQARYIMPKLLFVIEESKEDRAMRMMASRFFARGGTMQATLGSNLTLKEQKANRKIAEENNLLRSVIISSSDSEEQVFRKVKQMKAWYATNSQLYRLAPSTLEKIDIFFFETRFWRYMGRIMTLDFGTLRNDDNKTVISEVTKRFKYSLTLALLPMLLTLILCQVFGTLMAYKQNQWQDYSLSLAFLLLYALPIFVVAPFLIEKVALNRDFPFTHTPIPISGFTSPDKIYDNLNSYQQLFDILKHICLPLVAVIYGSLAAQSRLARTAILEVLRQDYVRTLWAKGVSPITILFKHVGRNASITIVTSLASSLGIVLGGSLIVETLFEIDGFGKFFYDAVINRDYNVIMFSSLAGSFLSLVGFLIADIAYTVLDPRLTLD